MRLIDANKLVSKINKLEIFYFTGETDVAVHDCQMVELGAVLAEIDDAPTVDAVEVVHGEWVVCGDGEYVPFMCSACGKTTSWYHKQTANYCPNCGAYMMDGDGNG